MFKTIPEMFLEVCNQYRDTKDAYKFKKDGVYIGIDYLQLRKKVECFALGLLNLGVRSKDRIGIVSENRIEWAIVDFAIVSLGAVDVPIFPTLTSKQEEYIFNDCQVSAIVVSNNFQLAKVMEFKENLPSLRHIIVMNEQFDSHDVAVKSMKYIMDRGEEIKSAEERKFMIEESISKIEPDDLLTLIYTSGTTGNPKGVMLTHANVVSNIIAAVDTVGFKYTDRFLTYLPWCHAYERTTGYYAAFSSGATVFFAEAIETIAANIKESIPTLMTSVPRWLEMARKKIFSNMEKESAIKQKIFRWAVNTGKKYVESRETGEISPFLKSKYLIADKLVFSKIRSLLGLSYIRFVSGGAALAPEVCKFFLSIGYQVIEGYGLTEASPVVSATDTNNYEIGTVGKPFPDVEIKIADDGEILVRGPNVMKGYWNDPRATTEAIDEEGWLYTGDIGKITEKGNLKITDRKKDIFVSSGGKNIAPQPIENLLAQSPFIEQVILIGENREFLTALITPDFEQLKKLADNFGIQYSNTSELIANEKIVQVIKNDIDRLQKDLSKYERVRKFSLLTQPFTVASGELTPKLNIKRHVVERKYSGLIETMYGVK